MKTHTGFLSLLNRVNTFSLSFAVPNSNTFMVLYLNFANRRENVKLKIVKIFKPGRIRKNFAFSLCPFIKFYFDVSAKKRYRMDVP